MKNFLNNVKIIIKKGATNETFITICHAGGGRNLSSCKGFTLAEVLVTLGIIGVVSAMTVPTLMQNHQRKTYVTQLHKVYNEITQAALQYQTDKNAVSLKEAGLTSETALYDFFKNYFKIVQDCGDAQTPCFADTYKKISGTVSQYRCKNACVSIASGVSLGTYGHYGDAQSSIVETIVVDTNGAKGPNLIGRDAFVLYLYSNGVLDDLNMGEPGDDEGWINVPAPLTEEQREYNFETSCTSNVANRFHGCFGKILNDNWEMNY